MLQIVIVFQRPTSAQPDEACGKGFGFDVGYVGYKEMTPAAYHVILGSIEEG